MNEKAMQPLDHSSAADLLPLLAAGRLERSQRAALERHLEKCPACQADLRLWPAVAGEVVFANRSLAAPAGLAERALRQAAAANPSLRSTGAHLVSLVRLQAPLVRRDLWPASAAVVAIGYAAATIVGSAVVIQAIAPLAAAGCLAAIFGSENDPASELAAATPTSAWQVLLARLTLVFGYNLALALAASLALLPVLPGLALGPLILSWLAPMAFLSAAALLLSLWVGTSNAISIAYLAWIGQFLAWGMMFGQERSAGGLNGFWRILDAYHQFWSAPAFLLPLALVLFAAALASAGRQAGSQSTWA